MGVFCQIIDSGSMASAARTLGIAPATVTGVLAASEKRLGVRLLDRTTRRLNPTEAGQIWYTYAKRILEESAVAEDAVRGLSSEPRGLLRLSLPLGVATTFVYPHLQEFSRQFPLIELDLQVSDRTVDLLEHGFDMALRVGRLKDSDLVARPLLQYQRALYASPAYLAAYGRPEHPDELVAHRCLLYQHDRQPVYWEFCVGDKTQKILVKGNLHSNETNALLTWARAGLGVTRQPTWLLRQDLKSGQLVSVLDDYIVKRPSELPGIYAILPKATRYPVKVEAFIAFFKQKIRDQPS
ncbi:LysR family transcriptional regulator [Undibacterium parvum]|uniref:LysR family transcriptional regulator n=2 Tax=Undibacterium parvum TaxID=401471 RepID=A0A3S5HMA1_9BURK|nr:LysR family transcriptional regulator [Undibacterium parvum]